MRVHKIIFTSEQQDFFIENHLLISSNDMAKRFGYHGCVVKRWMNENGIIVPKEISRNFAGAKRLGKTNFTAKDDAFVLENYLTMPIKSIGDQIGRSYTGIMACLKRLGLKIPPNIIQRNKESARIKPGNIPLNKGKKQSDYMSPDQIAKTAETRFKKGNRPANTKEVDGVISIRKDKDGYDYNYIRVSIGVWVPQHRHNWEKINGKIPPGHCLWCTGPDRLNCDPDNWELITRKENYRRNSGSVNLTDTTVANYIATMARKPNKELRDELLKYPEILELKRSEYLLNRAIKQQEYEQSAK